tara:strand:- start:175 stop:993 length:819 start_codon:yes stop_codon:yes gene_type:complete
MASPNSKATLKEYCLRALGKPVIEINVDDDQVDDRLDEALQYFAEFHMDGVERLYLKHQITAAEKTRAVTNISETNTDIVDNSISATWLEQKVWLPLNTNIISVLKVFELDRGTTSGNMFDMQYQMRLNDLHDFTSTSLVHYQMLQEQMDFMQHILVGEFPIRFNIHQNRLYLDMDWPNEVTDDHYIIIECYRKLNPTVYTDIYNDSYVKKYATALIKKQWGANLIKFNGVTMLGGVQMNGEIIYQQADEEIKLLEESMLNGYGLPADMMMG